MSEEELPSKSQPQINPFSALLNESKDNDNSAPKLNDNIDGKAIEKQVKLRHDICFVFNFITTKPGAEKFWPYHNNKEKAIKFNVIQIPDTDLIEPDSLEESLEALIFERLIMQQQKLKENIVQISSPKLKQMNDNVFDGVTEHRPLYYLFGCYCRNEKCTFESDQELRSVFRNDILNQAVNLITNESVFPHQNTTLYDLFNTCHNGSEHPYYNSFLASVSDLIETQWARGEGPKLTQIINTHLYGPVLKKFARVSLYDSLVGQTIDLIESMATSPNLGKAFLELNFPSGLADPAMASFSSPFNLLSRVLGLSNLPHQLNPELQYFLDRDIANRAVLEGKLGETIRLIVNIMHRIFYSLMKMPTTQPLLLNWIGWRLYDLRDRGQLVNEDRGLLQLPDGFCINLGNLLVLLCKPFSQVNSPKLLKIDARYCIADSLPINDFGNKLGVHMRGLKDETKLVPPPEGDSYGDIPIKFNFMTEIFFMAHKSIQLGFRALNKRFNRIMNLLVRLQRMVENQSGTDVNSEFERGLTIQSNMMTALAQEVELEHLLSFMLATCSWLNNLAMVERIEQAEQQFHPIEIIDENRDDGTRTERVISMIPEFIVENIVEVIIFIGRQRKQILTRIPMRDYETLITTIFIFMGNKRRMNNPHLRGRLAEVFEIFLPSNDTHVTRNNVNYFNMNLDSLGSHLFRNHPQINHLIPAMLSVFVSIEVTGGSVNFEEKFSYRRPIYSALKYFWRDIGEPHRSRMKQLAAEAEADIENPNPPLFLRFINLLTNDAIFLLDESLDSMKKLREIQLHHESEAWKRLSPQEQQQSLNDLEQLKRFTRFHNSIGNDTINTLSWLTEGIKSIFSHQIMVNRIASMLNYFLNNLVGPAKRNFKVRDASTELEFKPADIVHDICLIYINLSTTENPQWKQFCDAVVNDTRSYSESLIPLAKDVLVRTKKATGDIIIQLEHLKAKLDKCEAEQNEDDIAIEDVPDDFLDPIMSTVMKDPVKLPSGYIIDRSTIARHYLSDQSDPFTRNPINMQDLEPQEQLGEQIRKFVADYKAKKRQAKEDQ